MSGDFFANQERALHRIAFLIFLQVLAVASIIGLVYLLVAFILFIQDRYFLTLLFRSKPDDMIYIEPNSFSSCLRFKMCSIMSGIALFVIAWQMLLKIVELGKGGAHLLQKLGGRLIDCQTKDPGEKRLCNVVEEMAIASGMPMPQIYVLDREKSINALVVGFTPNTAALALSLGSLDRLTRDELQGVVAHEFSHILRADMWLNTRMIGVLAGISGVAHLGYAIMVGADPDRGPVYKSRGFWDIRGITVRLTLGPGLMAVGAIGLAFARLIQCAICRQTEYLADAAAVQFTRLPSGLAGALTKIAGDQQASCLKSSQASELAHLFFSPGVRSWLSIHPPLAERIVRIDPSVFKAAQAASSPAVLKTQAVAQRAGTITDAALAYGAGLLGRIPASLKSAVATVEGASLVIIGLLMDEDLTVVQTRLAMLRAHLQPESITALGSICQVMVNLDGELRLPLVELAAPALRMLTPAQREHFFKIIVELIAARGSMSVFEFALRTIVEQIVAPVPPPALGLAKDAATFAPDLLLALAMLARAGNVDEKEAQAAFVRAAQRLPGIKRTPDLTQYPDNYPQLGRTLHNVERRMAPQSKRVFIEACSVCVLNDGRVTVAETELLRAIALTVGVPMPPLADLVAKPTATTIGRSTLQALPQGA